MYSPYTIGLTPEFDTANRKRPFTIRGSMLSADSLKKEEKLVISKCHTQLAITTEISHTNR